MQTSNWIIGKNQRNGKPGLGASIGSQVYTVFEAPIYPSSGGSMAILR